MPKKNLEKFLKNLAQDPKLKARYVADPKQVMTEQGVDEKHQEMILKGDSTGITRELGVSDAICITHVNGYKK